jgi:peptidoglycan/LPS O-acetylase OafA/YrhL
MESMLLGAYFKANDEKIRGKFKWYHPILLVITFVLYFSSKLLFSKYTNISQFQIVNQLLIFVLLYCIMRFFSGMDLKLEKLPNAIKCVVSFLAGITLEIYLVQIVIIEALRNVAPFPLNWFILTSSIIVAAYALHLLSKYFMRLVDFAIGKLVSEKENEKNRSVT